MQDPAPTLPGEELALPSGTADADGPQDAAAGQEPRGPPSSASLCALVRLVRDIPQFLFGSSNAAGPRAAAAGDMALRSELLGAGGECGAGGMKGSMVVGGSHHCGDVPYAQVKHRQLQRIPISMSRREQYHHGTAAPAAQRPRHHSGVSTGTTVPVEVLCGCTMGVFGEQGGGTEVHGNRGIPHGCTGREEAKR